MPPQTGRGDVLTRNNHDASPRLEYGANVKIEDLDQSRASHSETTMVKEENQSEIVALKFKFN